MEKSIVGAYDSTTEVMDVINSLTKDGYTENDILVISNRNDLDNLDNTSGLHVEHPEGHHEERSLWEKIKDSFVVREHEGSTNDLSQYEIPLNQVGTYQSKLDDGKILVAVTATDKYVLSHGGEVVDAGANIKPVSDSEGIREEDEDWQKVNETSKQTSNETSPAAGKGIGNHGAEPEDIRSGNVDPNEDTIGGNVGNTLGGKLGTSKKTAEAEGTGDNRPGKVHKNNRQDNTEFPNEAERYKGNNHRLDF
jgi:hypothetical protein